MHPPEHPHSHSLLAILQAGIDIDTLGEERLSQLRSAGALAEALGQAPSCALLQFGPLVAAD